MTGAWLPNALFQTDVKVDGLNVQQSVPASLPLQPQVQGNELNIPAEDIIRSFGVATATSEAADKAFTLTPTVGTHKRNVPPFPVTERGMKLLTARDVNCMLNVAEAVNEPPSEGLFGHGITVSSEKALSKMLGSSSQQINTFTSVTSTTTTNGAGALNGRLESRIVSQQGAQM